MTAIPSPHLVHLFPSFEPGGAQLRVAATINHWKGRFRHTIVSLTGAATAAYRLDPALAVDVVQAGISGPPWRAWPKLARLLRRLRPDLVLTYNWGSIDAAIVAHALELAPVVHNECGMNDEKIDLQPRRVWIRRFLLPRIVATISTARTMERLVLDRFRVPAARSRFIRTGVDTDLFQPAPSGPARQRLGGRPGPEIWFGYAGGLRPVKNPGFLLDAFLAAALPDSRLILFGEGPERARLEAVAAALPGKVVFAGHQRDLSACLPALDVFLMSSQTEQTPNALLEAMACGLPVVCTAAGDSGILLAQGQADYVIAPGDRAGYVNALRALAADAGLRRKLGAANRRRAVEEFSLSRMFDEYGGTWSAAAGKR